MLARPAAALLILATVAGSTGAFAQTPSRPPPPAAARPDPVTPEQKQEREQELRRIEENLQRSQAENTQLGQEIVLLRGDRAKLSADLVATSQRVREAEARAAAAEQRVAALVTSETALKRSLETRRGTIVEVLASLQRLGRKPPPAVLVRPEDMLQAIRTSMLLGAVLPELRQEAELIAADLSSLMRTRGTLAAERDELAGELQRSRADRERLSALVAARQTQLESSESRLIEERRRVQQLVREAQTLKDLINRMEAEIASANRAAAAARAVPPPSQNPAQAAALAPGALRDLARLQPKVAFQDTKGTLLLPATGSVLKTFGTADGLGGRESGTSIETARFALVTTPVDGWISFAGSYRSYGQVLIINAGGGYHIVLTGLDRVSVETGQFVLAGEPIASMGTSPAGALVSEAGAGLPVVYIELRKDGVPIDPSPWWAKADGEKVRG
ncbi:MAG: peptidoglycan DD-metalloendopeptidase family protein [Methylocystis sp.]|nr:peptidoglycan DD-metalloendopeptidase family protein [Methylocystis sp.]MCA3584954.1 peptidoglycan DD-metalloendopeptidase family protein [Methylocystis sp.]MCA3589844.1 peptidoglycan DD-metalloendopeptidase family protein [Methylocystis sp.]MCA3593493.1 peptidoglycan DD-metalloendopeptidase family protein [Methylocystis sp.]